MFGMTEDDPGRTVAAGYDAITETYAAWTAATSDPARITWLERFAARLPDKAAVLELGCGQGGPSTAFLAERSELLGIDISAHQLDRARVNVPAATFELADMSDVVFDPGRFDGIVALYSIIHVPRERHALLFGRIATWLKAGGWFLASFGTEDDPGGSELWLGSPMYFSGFDAMTNLAMLEDAGLRVADHEIVTLHEPPPEGDTRFQWVLAQRR
jgi:cyclopropane fatty-acyl-phospholipid synthase-like methyltransferase